MSDKSASDGLIAKWLDGVKWAASGGNQQLWKVAVAVARNGFDFHISIPAQTAHLAASDTSGAGALLSLGCFSFCLEEVGRSLGYSAVSMQVESGVDFWGTTIYMQFRLSTDGVSTDGVAAIQSRRTSRLPFKSIRVPDSLISEIRESAGQDIEMTDLTTSKDEVIRFVEDMTLLRMGNKALFLDLLNEIYWRADEPNRMTGLPIDTLGLSKFLDQGLKIAKRHPFFVYSRLIHGLALNQSVRRPLGSASHIFHIGIKNSVGRSRYGAAEDWIEVGRALQRVWLLFEKNDVSLQPFAVNLILVNHFSNPKQTILDSFGIRLAEKGLKQMEQGLGIDILAPGMIFRIGYPLSMAAASPRRPVEVALAPF